MAYRIEDLVYYNRYKDTDTSAKDFTFPEEHRVSREDKVKAIDEFEWKGQTGWATYYLDIIAKFLEDSEQMPKDSWGYVKTVSLIAWLKKNDPREAFDRKYHYGKFHFINREYLSIDTKATCAWGCHPYDTGTDVVNLWYHDMIWDYFTKEEKYFRENNPLFQKIKKVMELGREYGATGIHSIDMLIWNGERVIFDEKFKRDYDITINITEDVLDDVIRSYDKLEMAKKDIFKELEENL